MRFGVGLAVLAVGVVGLGWWARMEYAPHVQRSLSHAAGRVADDSMHGVVAQVEGRDITVTGLADGPAERDALIAAFRGIRGRRVVVDALQVLPVADPYDLRALWIDGALDAEGHAPTRAAQEALAAVGADGLVLAAGAPDGHWARAAGIGLQVLTSMNEGQLAISGRRMSVNGVVPTPIEGEAVRAALDALPEGYVADLGLVFVDDGTPPSYALNYDVVSGAWLDGKLPRGLDGMVLAQALGLADIEDNATVALMGDEGQVPPALSALAPWMAELETLDLGVAPEGVEIIAGFGAGADLDLLRAALQAELDAAGSNAALAVTQVGAEGEDGARRVHRLTGADEELRGGFWLPVAPFDPSPDSCAALADATLAEHRIGFVTGSARLDAQARGAVNALAAVLGPCLRDAGLRAEIGGHTDSTGSDEANQALSLQRADAVRAALLARGMPEAALTAAGYGASEPVADNDSEDGRAANRRTAVRWIE